MAKKRSDRIPYAELRRRLKLVHNFSWKMPKVYVRKKDKERAKRSVERLLRDKEITIPEARKIIKSRARDYAITRALTPQQKASITKLYYGKKNKEFPNWYSRRKGGLKNAIDLVMKQDAIFVQVRKGSHKRLFKRMKRTNKGVFLFEKGVSAKVLGKGKEVRIKIQRLKKPPKHARVEEFFPFPPGVIVMDYIDKLYNKYKPDSMTIGVMSARGSKRVSKTVGFNYIEEFITKVEKRGKTHPFSGVYFFWF